MSKMIQTDRGPKRLDTLLDALHYQEELVTALTDLMRRYPEEPGTYTPEGTRARKLLNDMGRRFYQ